MPQERRKNQLTDEEVAWIKDHVETTVVWKERRKKIIDAVSIWAVIAILSSMVAIFSGAGKWILLRLAEMLP